VVLFAIVRAILYEYKWREQPDANTGVTLELSPARQTVKIGDEPTFTVTRVNQGPEEVALVEPGDGSTDGWRTPRIAWSYAPPFERSYRCGNINALRRGSVFRLKPGERRQVHEYCGHTCPPLRWSGTYQLALRYTNDPDMPWRGMPLGEHDTEEWERLKASTPLTVVSNTVEVVVE
jgi:hypothetical protein